MMPFEVSILNDPVIVSSHTGVITDINEQFTRVFEWTRDEIIGQNAHLLIPSKFIRKSTHDRRLKGYSFGKDSNIIGKSRIVPVSTPEDEEVIATIKIIPIRSKKEFCFMVLFNKIEFHRRFADFDNDFKSIRTKLKKLKKNEEFREDSLEASQLVKEISRLFAKELEVVEDFIVENAHSESVVSMCKHFLLNIPIGNLARLQREMRKVFDNNNISYLNVICLRIVFPSIIGRTDINTINKLKISLYEASDEDTSSTVS